MFEKMFKVRLLFVFTFCECISLFKICCLLDVAGMSLLGKLETFVLQSGQNSIYPKPPN